MADLAYTTADDIEEKFGTIAVNLRTDDADEDTLVAKAIDFASGRVDFYCRPRFAAADLADNRWVRDVATLIACIWLFERRGNDVPERYQKEWEERKEELQMILEKKADVPGAPMSRRPIGVTNVHVDLRLPNNQVRVDKTRSTGVAKDYLRPVDNNAPDQR